MKLAYQRSEQNKLKRIIQCFIGLSLYSVNPFITIAQESLEILTTPSPVFSEYLENGEMSGFSVEYARSIAQLAGYTPSFTALPFARLIKQIRQSKLTIATGIGRTPEREDDFYWIAPMTANVIGLFSIIDNPPLGNFNLQNSKADGFKHLTSVGVLRGDYRVDILRKNGVKNIVEYNDWKQVIGAVLKGRVSSIFFSELGVSVTCRLNNFDCTKLKKSYTHDTQFTYMAMLKNKENRKHAMKLARAAEHFIKTPEFNRFIDTWLPRLQVLKKDISIVEGVAILGENNNTKAPAGEIWVLTNLEPPFSQYDERGRLSGYAIELIQNILTEAGLRQQILAAPWQRILVESEMKANVLAFSLARIKEREEKFHWISPITQNAYSVFGHKSDHHITGISKIEQLPPQSRISVLAGDFRQQRIIDAGHIAVASRTWQLALQTFIAGESDYLFFSDGGVEMMCKTINSPCSTITRILQLQPTTTYLAISKKGTSEELVNKLKAAAISYKASRQYKTMTERWLTEYRRQKMPKMNEKNGIIKLWE